jgi:DsbC/DsbD-like thiol-disulfide interchange protein
MNRRDFLFAPIALTVAWPAFAAGQPWSARLLKGGFDGSVWWSGLMITLAPDWKTYWRVPGDGGIAPSFEIAGENIKTSRIDYPLPQRFRGEAGTTIGYKEAVVFPFAIAPQDSARPVSLSLKAFFGVCDEVCIPAPYDAAVQFDPASADAPDQAIISQWRAEVPQPGSDGPVKKATAKEDEDGFYVLLDTSESIREMFVEGNPAHYFGEPFFMRGLVRVAVTGAKSRDELRATALRLTLRTASKGLEQMVTVV